MTYGRILLLLIILILFNPHTNHVLAQSTNSWIDYNKPYVKIKVSAKGIYRLPFSTLPVTFPVDHPEKFQLWHLGKQVAIISHSNNEILFYGIPNTGSSDSLLYRPMSSRLNPYFSIYSDESAYFLTVSDSKSLRSQTISQTVDNNATELNYHLNKDVTALKSDYSLSTANPTRPTFFNSFFEKGASRTGTVILKNTQATFPITLTNPVKAGVLPKLKILIHGRSNNSRNVEVYVGKTEKTIRLAKTIPSSGFEGVVTEFDILESDLVDGKTGFLVLKSISSELFERFSVGYYSIEYPQAFIANSKSQEFILASQSASSTRVSITGAEDNSVVYDITDTTKIISGSLKNLMITRKAGQPLKLLVASQITTVPVSQISLVNFQRFDPTKANYIVVTSENLLESANAYSLYRSSKSGGAYKTVVASINDIYNQFNYGEPSPVGVRNFISYMLSDGNKDKYLFLIGKSISYIERMVKEMPNEVPTVGFPGSDVLLVDNLAGGKRDVPSIPVGRFSALTNDNVLDYLQKVKDYEHDESEHSGWRKRILHLNGGKTAGEITQFKNVLEALRPTVENGFVGGKVSQFVKQQAIGEVEKVDITPEVNDGVGMITYFGHGSTVVTDLDMGYITDAARGYNNPKKYPFMFFNGCDVGNIFSARFNRSPTASDRMALSMDWMITPNKGAIAIVANSFAGYVGPLTNYINSIYKAIFADSSLYSLPIGKIQQTVADQIVATGGDSYDIANIHQSLLQGDPSLVLVSETKPDYALDINEGIKLFSESADKNIGNSSIIRTGIILSNLGKFVKGQKVPISIDYFYKNGKVENKKEVFLAIPYQDTLSFTMADVKNVQRIVATVDPDTTISELSRRNNVSELNIEWDRAVTQNVYPTETVKDLVAPTLKVTLQNRVIKNEEVLAPNPVITVTVEDDRIVWADTSLIDIFIKPCWDELCSFEPISYTTGNFRLDTLTSHSFTITFLSDKLLSGNYELLVNARDASGNLIAQPYNIRFQISDQESIGMSVICSPNPASSYIKLETEVDDYNSVESLQYLIYNLNGDVLEDRKILKIKSAKQEWYWQPKSVTSGLYIYKVIKVDTAGSKQITGKVVMVK